MGTIDTIRRQAVFEGGPLAAFVRKLPPGMSAVYRIMSVLEIWAARRRSRRALAMLSDYHLRDIGITRAQAMEEAARPFWDGEQFPDAW